MPIYDKNNKLIEHVLDASRNEIDIERIHAAPHIMWIKIPNLIKPADDYSIALRYDYYDYKFPRALNDSILNWQQFREDFMNEISGNSQALASAVANNCVNVATSGFDPENIYIGSNFQGSNKKGCEPWYRSYTYDYAINDYIPNLCRSDDQALAIGRTPGDHFNPDYANFSATKIMNNIKAQAANNLTYRELGFVLPYNYLGMYCRYGALTQLDPQRRWDNFGELIHGTQNGALDANNEVYSSGWANTTDAIAQYILYYDAELSRYMYFNIRTLRRSFTITPTSYTGVGYVSTFKEYIKVDVTKPIYFILDNQMYNYAINSNTVIHNYYTAISDTFDTLIRCRIDNGNSKSVYSKTSLDVGISYPDNGHMHVMEIDLYKDRFLVDGWKYPNNQKFVGVHPSDDVFLFNEFNVLKTGNPINNWYSENSSSIETTKYASGTGGDTQGGSHLRPFARMWLDFEAI